MKTAFRVTLCLSGVALISFALFTGYRWYYKLAPSKKVLDPEWVSAHSPEAYWNEVQAGIRRGQWNHDDGFAVGRNGDKSWATWIMTRVEPNTSMGCLGSQYYHSATAMEYITNQRVGENSDDWLAWWENNASTSQLEWISDGFKLHDISLDPSPTSNQVKSLLDVLGEKKSDDDDNEYLRYNAFRWLRDSGFDPVEFVVGDADLSDTHMAGLHEYARREHYFPRALKLGLINLGNDDQEVYFEPPMMLDPVFEKKMRLQVWGALALGIIVLGFCVAKRKKKG